MACRWAKAWVVVGLIGRVRTRRDREVKKKKDSRNTPLFVTVNQPRRNGADVRASADKEENDEKKRLKVEERGLRWVG